MHRRSLHKHTRVRAVATLAALAVAIGGAVAQAAAGEPPSARAAVEETLGKVLEVLAEDDWSVAKRIEKIEGIVYQRFDFGTISRLVLARNYRKFTPAQVEEFEISFKSYLSRSYGSRVERYDQETVEVVDERAESRGDVTVRTRVVGGQADGIEIHYRMRQGDGRWQVIDVVIEGVSLVSNFRSQFQEVVSEGGPELLLERIQQKNEAREAG